MFCLPIKKNKILCKKTQNWADISIHSELKSLRLQHSSVGPPLDNGRSHQVPEQTAVKKHWSRLKPLLWNTAVSLLALTSGFQHSWLQQRGCPVGFWESASVECLRSGWSVLCWRSFYVNHTKQKLKIIYIKRLKEQPLCRSQNEFTR